MNHNNSPNPGHRRTGWVVALSGLGINLALGVLYSWSVFAAALRTMGWTATQTQIPYMLACAVFALLMVPGGRLQDQYGPKPVLIAASVLTGAAFVFSGFFMTLGGLMVFFGIVFGTGMAFGYATTTPTAIKWFDASQRGLVSGIVVSGFGLAGIYVAPLTTFLYQTLSLKMAFILLGVFYCVVMFLLHFLIKNPPAGYSPAVPRPPKPNVVSGDNINIPPRDMLKTYQFYLLWIMFFCGTFAGLKILGQLSSIGREQALLSIQDASLLVMVYALFNCVGRFACGFLSDKIGRRKMIFIIFLIQVIVFLLFSRFNSFGTLSLGTAFIALSFGGMLALFPSITADFYGTQNLGVNYGLLFTAWGVGGLLGPLVGGMIRDYIGHFDMSYLVSMAVCFVGLILSLLVRKPGEKAKAE